MEDMCPKCGSTDLLTDGSCRNCGWSPFFYTVIIEPNGDRTEVY